MGALTWNLIAAVGLISWDKGRWKLRGDRLWLHTRNTSPPKLCRAGPSCPVLSRVPALRVPRRGCPSSIKAAERLRWAKVSSLGSQRAHIPFSLQLKSLSFHSLLFRMRIRWSDACHVNVLYINHIGVVIPPKWTCFYSFSLCVPFPFSLFFQFCPPV